MENFSLSLSFLLLILSFLLFKIGNRSALKLQRDNQFVKSLNGAPSIAGLCIVYLCLHCSWGFVIWNVFWKSIKVALSDFIELEKCGRSKGTGSLRCWDEEWVSKGWRWIFFIYVFLRGACFTNAGSSVPRVCMGLAFPCPCANEICFQGWIVCPLFAFVLSHFF